MANIQNTFLFMALVAIGLLFLTHLICQRWFKDYPASSLSGAVIMTFALYVAECLPQYKLPVLLMRLPMLEVIVLWVYGSFSLLQDFFLKETGVKPSERSGLSAWIVGTSLTCIMVGRINPLLHGAILLLVIFAVLLWFKYAFMVCYALVGYIRNKFQEYVSPSLLLGSAATASIAWVLFFVFQDKFSNKIYETFIVLSCLLYVFISLMMLGNFYRRNVQNLLVNWSAENSLVFGVSSFIGLTSLVTQAAPDSFIDVAWFWSAIFCALMTLFELFHVFLRQKVWVYDVKHWLRIFSYSIFYVFTWYYYFEHYSDGAIVTFIAEHGLNVITLLLVIQIVYVFFTLRASSYDGRIELE